MFPNLMFPSSLRMSLQRLASSLRLSATKTKIVHRTNFSTYVQPKTGEIAPNAVKDIVLYRYEKPRFFRYLSIFALSQYGVWLFISYCSLDMVDVPVPTLTKEQEEELPFWRKMNLGQAYYKYGLTAGSVLMGFTILAVSWGYIFRSVRYLVLRKDGKTVAFITYTPFGRNKIIDVPINHISAYGSRTSGSAQMPVKIKGKGLYYLVEVKEGKFPNPQLFDRTVGTKRKLD